MRTQSQTVTCPRCSQAAALIVFESVDADGATMFEYEFDCPSADELTSDDLRTLRIGIAKPDVDPRDRAAAIARALGVDASPA
jgi:hypothetical protein